MGDRYWGLQTADWNGASGWFSDAGLTIPAADPTSSDDVKFVAGSFTGAGQILTVNSDVYCKDIDWTGALNTPTLTFTTGAILGIYGNCTLINAMVIPTSVSAFIVFCGDSNHSLTTNGVTINTQYVGSYSGTGTLTLLDDLNCRTLLLREGVLNTNGKTVTGSNFYSPYTYVRGLFLGGSTLNFSSIYGWNSSGSTNFTLNAGTSTINLSSSGTFAGGGQTYNIVNLNGSAHTVSGNNRIAKLGLNPTGTQTITWTDRSSNKIGEMTRTGSEIITFQGSGAAGWALTAIGGIVCSLYNMSISRGTATARRFFAGTNSTNGGNNVGWLFHNKPNACFTALRTPATQLCIRR